MTYDVVECYEIKTVNGPKNEGKKREQKEPVVGSN